MRKSRFNVEERKIKQYGQDILLSDGMKKGRTIRHHGKVNVYKHSLGVALFSLFIVRKLHMDVDEESMVRGALLHDYYLYDRHEDENVTYHSHRFGHAKTAYKNADRDFTLNDVEKDIIKKHMFPVNRALPRYKESKVVCVADKISAINDYVVNAIKTIS